MHFNLLDHTNDTLTVILSHNNWWSCRNKGFIVILTKKNVIFLCKISRLRSQEVYGSSNQFFLRIMIQLVKIYPFFDKTFVETLREKPLIFTNLYPIQTCYIHYPALFYKPVMSTNQYWALRGISVSTGFPLFRSSVCMYVCMYVCPYVRMYVRKLPVTVFERKTWNLVHSILVDLEKNYFFVFSNFEFLRAFLPPFTPKNVEKWPKKP